MSALPAHDGRPEVLVPHWLSAGQRTELATTVRDALAESWLHPLAGIHLQDVLTELHVATAREAVWPTAAARVRLATGWGEDVLPVRLSAPELAGVLGLPALPTGLRALLGNGAAR